VISEPLMPKTPEPIPRRRWLLHSLQGSIAATLAALFYPVVRFLQPRAATTSGAPEVVAPYKLNQLKADAEGHWPAPFNFGGKPCLLILTPDGAKRLAGGQKLDPGDLRAFNAICTHLDCTVEYRSDQADIFCNCHNGVYNLNGTNISGPPPRPLEEYKVTLRNTDKPGQEEIVVSRTT
jgi:cytochrome b6-f complex iron-sulfur subunit